MRRPILFLLALALLPIFCAPASAQMSNMPEDLRARLAEINPTWGKDILGNVATTLALYTPLLAAAPKGGVRIESDLAYGPDPLHRLDIHKQEGRTGVPIVVFLHGGAYVREPEHQRGSVWQCCHLLRAAGHVGRQRDVPAGAGGEMAGGGAGCRLVGEMAKSECGGARRIRSAFI